MSPVFLDLVKGDLGSLGEKGYNIQCNGILVDYMYTTVHVCMPQSTLAVNFANTTLSDTD